MASPSSVALGPSNATLMERSHSRCQLLLLKDAELASAQPDALFTEQLLRESCSSAELLDRILQHYADRVCMAERAFERCDDDVESGEPRVSYLAAFTGVSYGQVRQRAVALAHSLQREHGAGGSAGVVSILGHGSVDWVVAYLGCLFAGFPSALMQTNLPLQELQHLIAEAESSCLLCSALQRDLLPGLVKACPALRRIVLMDLTPGLPEPSWITELRSISSTVTVCSIDSLTLLASDVPPALCSQPPVDSAPTDPLRVLMYTSGSTGLPKGAMHTERIVLNFLRGLLAAKPSLPVIHVSYLPLNHLAGMIGLLRALLHGGLSSFVLDPHMSTLFDDIRLVRPTFLLLVPRIVEMIYQTYQVELLTRMHTHPKPESTEACELSVMASMRYSYLGERLLWTITGSAPLAPSIHAFFKRCFDVSMLNVYGATENLTTSVDGQLNRERVLEYRLLEAPELGYSTADRPHPRGELLMKLTSVVPGYFKRPQSDYELCDENGFMHTGDIVEELGPFHVQWIDRRRNILKLSQGEFVSVSRIEGVLTAASPFIAQAYVYGNALRSYTLAVVVPNMDNIRVELIESSTEPGSIKALLRREVARAAQAAHLAPHEIPRDILVEMEPFSRENGLLTESNKMARPQLKRLYGQQLEGLYQQLEDSALSSVIALQTAPTTDVVPTVDHSIRESLKAALGVEDVDLTDEGRTFTQLGGDSINALHFTRLLHLSLGVSVHAALVVDPSTSLAALCRAVRDAAADANAANGALGSSTPTMSGGQCKEAETADDAVLHASSIRLDDFMPEQQSLDSIGGTPASSLSCSAPRSALLTGCTGFLGKFLLLELLERLPAGGSLYCVIRAKHDDEAWARLRSAMVAVSAAATALVDACWNRRRLQVFAGDVSRERLGLSEAVHQRLSTEVDVIVHNAAWVNHVFSYQQLRGVNVVGTVHVMRLALHGRLKRICFVSTTGLLAGAAKREVVMETDELAQVWPSRNTRSGYAAGYTTSKWVCELLLSQLHERFHVPVTVFRCSIILPHRSLAGQANPADLVSRLLCGVVWAGVAPCSFFSGQFDGVRHFDGVPVDVVAQAIAGIGLERDDTAAHRVFHVSNPHYHAGVSEDSLVDWTETAGYPLRRVDDYSQWLAEFRASLEKLPAAKQKASPLALMELWAQPRSSASVLADSGEFTKALARVSAGNAVVPCLSEAYVHKYLGDLTAQGLLERPALSSEEP
jgi:fatty acid CoA ligase FadD9